MNKIFRLSLANIRKSKSQSFNLLIFVMVAAMLLNLGLLLLFDFGNFFENEHDKRNAAHYSLLEEKAVYSEEQTAFLKNDKRVTEYEKETAVGFFTDISYHNGKMPVILFMTDADNGHKIDTFSLIEGKHPQDSDEICLPYIYSVGGGYEVGDNFSFILDEHENSFRVVGFTAEMSYGSMNNTMYRLYLSKEGFDKFCADYPTHECVLQSIRTDVSENGVEVDLDFSKKFFFRADLADASSLFIHSLSYDDVRLVRTMMADLTSVILVLVAAIIVIISLIVIRFRIRNSIEETMTNIGALKAIGYRSRQLIWSIVFQFLSISAVGTIVGIGGSYALLTVVARVLEVQTALRWHQGFDSGISIITFAALLLAVLLVSLVAAYGIRKIHPLVALRGGISNHSFKKNHLPLDKTRGKLTILLGMKSLLQSKGQAVMIFIIIATVSFLSATGVSIYYNIGVHTESFANLLMGEMPDAGFLLVSGDDDDIYDKVQSHPNVRKAFYYQDLTVVYSDIFTQNTVTDDFSDLEGQLLYEGRYPKHANEVSISGKLSDRFSHNIGDTVTIGQGDVSGDYLVVGLIQTVNEGGNAIVMTTDGARRLLPDFKPSTIYAYLYDKDKVNEFLEDIKSGNESAISNANNIVELIEAQMGTYTVIFSAVAAAILVVTALVIILVLFLIIKTVILRRRRTLGVQKALGFTTMQLMNQMTLAFLPTIIAGVAVGGLAGMIYFNKIFVALVRGMGLMTASLPSPVGLTLIVLGGLIVLAYIVSMLICLRIRKISAYSLVTE